MKIKIIDEMCEPIFEYKAKHIPQVGDHILYNDYEIFYRTVISVVHHVSVVSLGSNEEDIVGLDYICLIVSD